MKTSKGQTLIESAVSCFKFWQLTNRQTYRLLTLMIATWAMGQAYAQKVQQKPAENTRILFLLDGSGSMLGKWEARPRIATAKLLLSNIVDSLRVNSNVQLGLRVYGHLFPREKQNCQDTRLEVPFGAKTHDAIISRLSTIKPKGTTPIAYSLERAVEDFPKDSRFRNIIIIITDGKESCDGNPCEVSLKLQRKGIFLKPFIIGLGGDRSFGKQFNCIGQYYDGKDVRSFRKALDKAITTALGKTTTSVALLDSKGLSNVSNVNVTFVNNFTAEAVYEFVHYRDLEGKPDSVEIDPVLSYDLIVNTIPPVIKKNIPINPGAHNLIRVKAPQGKLKVIQKGHKSYPRDVQILVKYPGKKEIINVQPIGETHDYLTGTYDVEVLTLPKRIFKSVQINQYSPWEVKLPDPGILNIKMLTSGYGGVYEILPDGRENWVYNLPEGKTQDRVVLQPGKYKIVFRAKNAPGSKFTTTKTVIIKSGYSSTINLFD